MLTQFPRNIANERDLVRTIESWRRCLTAEPVGFIPAMWRVVLNSPDYAPSKDHGTVTHPKWRKAHT
jgi:hypothetical protein